MMILCFLVFLLAACYFLGLCEYVDRKLNPPSVNINPETIDLTEIRNDIDKIKLSLNFKEFKR